MKLSVVIATRDRAGFLERALESLAAQDDPPEFEVVVADNGSSDATAEVVARHADAGRFPLRRVFVPEPNRSAARNAGIAEAGGPIVVFVDDDVWLPAGFLAAHARAHADGVFPSAVSGPIVNVPSYETRPKPNWRNFSQAFFCTCNVSVPRSALLAVGSFDATFNLYGWEDTELGLRLRRHDVRRFFAWDAYLWHVKPPEVETLDVVYGKTVELGRMAAVLLEKDDSPRARLATGAYDLNLLRAALTAPPWLVPALGSLARNERLPAPLRSFARGQYLDGAYVQALRKALAERGR
ncbi:MAG: glycosyltransferase family A protein [Candidatus Baltobacteraceae bacterium]|jgi:glycosyltransferase involved in cell wall biosynthesis